ncbi:MAG: TolC family protein [Sphingobacteriales bacterium]
MRQQIINVLLLFHFLIVCSEGTHGQSILEQYIQTAIKENLVLKQKNISLERSLLALKEAKSLYQPSTWLDGQYFLSQGGRQINIPVGDLVNPVYATLNQLTSSNRFPQIENVSEQLNPNNFYDLRIKTALPLINKELDYNKKVKEKQITLLQQEADVYTRELVKEVKSGYYSILMAKKAVVIYTSALSLVKENLRVNRSLLSNGKSLPAYVSRAESELFQVEAQLTNAVEQVKKAEAWFNALLNRPINAAIDIEEIKLTSFIKPSDSLNSSAREELFQLNTVRSIQTELLKLNQAYRTPKLTAFVDLAAQDFNFTIRSQSFFYLGGIQFSMPIYSANRNKLKMRQTELDLKQTEVNALDIKNKLDVVVFQAKSQVNTSYERYLSSLKQEEAANQYFRLIERGYKEGINSFIEWLDARNQLTQAQLQKEIVLYTYLNALAELERQTASFPINRN